MATSVVHQNGVTWTNIEHPTADDIEALSLRYPQFHPLNLQDCLTELEYPKLDYHDHYIFLVAQMPMRDAAEQLIRPAEVDIFVGHDYLVTAHRAEMQPLADLYLTAQDPASPAAALMLKGEAAPLLYHLLDGLVDECYPLIQQMGTRLRRIEQDLLKSDTRKILFDITVLRRDIIATRGILKSQIGVIDTLVKERWSFISDELDPYWGDISDHLLQLCGLLDQYAEIVGGLSEAIDTLASHRIDEVIRLLTVVTIITLPITLLATIFGMNIVMPFSDRPSLFYLLVFLGLVFSVWLLWYLRRRRWM